MYNPKYRHRRNTSLFSETGPNDFVAIDKNLLQRKHMVASTYPSFTTDTLRWLEPIQRRSQLPPTLLKSSLILA